MIFRPSQRLKAKIKISGVDLLALDDNPFADWSAHVFVADRTQYILLCNTKSLYSAVMIAKGIMTENLFITRSLANLRAFLENDGLGFIYPALIAPASTSVRFAKPFNRAVIGSMNDLIYQATRHIIEKGIAPNEVGFKLNYTPFSSLGYSNPREVFKSMVAMPVFQPNR